MDSSPEPRPLSRVLDRLLHLLLPSPCLGCGAPLPARPSPFGLCGDCRRNLPWSPRPACATCGRPVGSPAPPAGWRCGPCREHPPSFHRLLAAWTYRPPAAEVLRGLKFRRLDYLGRQLGGMLAKRFASELTEEAPGAVVPVPLHWARRWRRGFDQGQLIARGLAEATGIPLLEALRRRRATPPQSSLGRTRRLRNLQRALEARPSARTGLPPTLLLVDDVVTTGATLEVAASVLQRAGAGRVVAVVAARTPSAGEGP